MWTNERFSLLLTATCVHFPSWSLTSTARLLPVAVQKERKRKKEWRKERKKESFFWALCSEYCRLCLPVGWDCVGCSQVSASTKANNEHYYCLTFIVSSYKCLLFFVALQRFHGFSLFQENKEARSVVSRREWLQTLKETLNHLDFTH